MLGTFSLFGQFQLWCPILLQVKHFPSFTSCCFSSTLSAFTAAPSTSIWSSLLTPHHWDLSHRPLSSLPHPSTVCQCCPLPCDSLVPEPCRLALISAQSACCVRAAFAQPSNVFGRGTVFLRMALWSPRTNPCLKSISVPASFAPHPTAC